MRFKTGKQYKFGSICDNTCIILGEVIKRTEKTVIIRISGESDKRCKIHLDRDGNEFVYPFGRYSMCPVMRSSKEV